MFDFLNQYTILGSIYLEELYSLPSSTLYRFLQPIKKEVFAPHERVVFYNFASIDSRILAHLANTIQRLDIPEFVVLVVTNQLETQQYFDNKIQVNLVDHPQSITPGPAPEFNVDNRLCAHAWAGIHIFPDGYVGPCCDSSGRITDKSGNLCNIKDYTIKELVDSDWMQDLRNQFRQGQKPASCQTCWKRESLGLDSRRTLTLYKLENVYDLINWEQEGQLMYLGGGIGNICNSKCRICSSQYSSSIASEELQELPAEDRKKSLHYTFLENGRWALNSKFWDELKSLSSNIKNFELVGGEPLILKQNIDFLKFLVTRDYSKDTIVYLSTNVSAVDDIIELAPNFKRVELTVSVDNLKEKFELERFGNKWEDVDNNVQKLIRASKKHSSLKINLAVAVNIQNVYDIPDVLDWADKSAVSSTYFYYLTDPAYLSIVNLTDEAKQLVKNKLLNCGVAQKHQHHIDTILNIIDQSSGSDGKEFVEQMKRQDSLRNQNFLYSHTDIAKAMGYL